MQKNHLFVFLILTSIIFNACSSSKHTGKNASMPGTWQAQPIVIDANSNDWPSPYPSYDSKGMIGYATSNDREYLYVTMETGDEMTQMKILKQGMTVWIDTDGKKEGVMSIHYPVRDENETFDTERPKAEGRGQGSPNIMSGMGAKLKKGVSDAIQMTLEGFKGCTGGFSASLKNGCGIKVKIGIDEYKELIWEAAIPFKAIYGTDTLNRKDVGRPISVCYAIKGFKKPSTNDNSASGPSGGGMGSGGMSGSGMGGGRMGGGRGGKGSGRSMGVNPQDQLFESTKTWKQFGLAWQ